MKKMISTLLQALAVVTIFYGVGKNFLYTLLILIVICSLIISFYLYVIRPELDELHKVNQRGKKE